MKILIVLTYYRPHISGLTIYAERLARAFAARGHQVTVLTSRFDRSLPTEEVLHGVRIVRTPVLFRLSKGVIMPTFGYLASKLVREHDVVQLHLPQFDAAGVALRGRLLGKPTVVTYHCDLELPPGLFNRIANQVVLLMNHLTAMLTHRIVTYTEDYAAHSAYTRRFAKKVAIIPPPVELPEISAEERLAFGEEHNPQQRHPVIGMLARFATEKGVEVLLNAIPSILDRYPQALFEFVGPYQNIIGEEAYYERLKPLLDQYQASGHWKFLGPLPPEKVAAFFANLDLLCVPSLNSTESFGLVQIEAMINGVRCITSDLPGVRQPVLMHHMGRIIPIGDSAALARSVLELLDDPADKPQSSKEFQRYDPDQTARRYEDIFAEIMSELKQQ
ncbi:MAG TPA: glycosyltransferase family 4 protein [Anaerolineaceae bacterium]|nr:glycosyltransferase family 4 protein [Anaerolineaceae bacterium]